MANSLSDQIKSILTACEVAEHYGFTPNRAGYIPCPFHNEKTASLKLYPEHRGWRCFGCNEGGSVIDFAMKLFGITFPQAVLRLNLDFRLGLTAERPTQAEASKAMRERQRVAQELEKYRREYDSRVALFQAYWAAKKGGEDYPLYAEALIWLPHLDYYFETHPWR